LEQASPEASRLIEIHEFVKAEQIGSELINKMSEPYQPQKFENKHKKLQHLIDQKHREKNIIMSSRR
jgi:hypothetical protein